MDDYREFDDELLDREQILWSGRPDPTMLFTEADIFLVPFSLMWGGFAFVWEYVALTNVANAGGPPSLVFPLFGIPFVLVGLYMIVGRFIYKAWRKRNTYYAVTNQRVLILTKGVGREVQAAFINAVPSLNKAVRPNGSGTVGFGNSSPIVSMYGNTGMDFLGSFYGKDVPTFYDIPDADTVYSLVSELRKKSVSPS